MPLARRGLWLPRKKTGVRRVPLPTTTTRNLTALGDAGRRSTMGGRAPMGATGFPSRSEPSTSKNRERVLPRETVRASTARALRPSNQSTLGSPARPPLLAIRSQRACRVLGTAERGHLRHGDHARAHQDPRRRRGARYPLDHLSFEPDEIGGRGRGRGRDGHSRGCWGVATPPRERRAKGADRAGDADDDAGRTECRAERARRAGRRSPSPASAWRGDLGAADRWRDIANADDQTFEIGP